MHKVIFPLVALLAFVAAFFLYWSGLAYQRGILELGPAFGVLQYSAIAGLTGTGLCIFYMLWRRPPGPQLAVLFVSALVGIGTFYLPYRQQIMAGQVPPIHDISTDTTNPPVFVEVLRVRADAPNPPEYAGSEVAAQQKQAYPDLMTQQLMHSPAAVFEAALALVDSRGWNLVGSDADSGRIEATATTRWFGFRDDVVMRIRPAGNGSAALFDMRSKSRVGRSDIGANAARIRAFIADLQDRLGS